jgi:plastocyanin
MTSPWDICFKVTRVRRMSLLAMVPLLCARLWAGTVAGSVELDPGISARPASDLSGVVIWLEPQHSRAEPVPRRERMVQKNKTFLPHVLPVEVGSTVDFPNLDPIFHNAFSNFNGQIFDVSLYPPGTSKSVVFHQPGVVRVFCNIHPSMSAVILVVDTPYFAVTDRAGHYSIPDVPAGTYRCSVFHERATPDTLAALSRSVEAGDGQSILPTIRISETGYIPMPHMNKHGHSYPRGADDQSYGIPQ